MVFVLFVTYYFLYLTVSGEDLKEIAFDRGLEHHDVTLEYKTNRTSFWVESVSSVILNCNERVLRFTVDVDGPCLGHLVECVLDNKKRTTKVAASLTNCSKVTTKVSLIFDPSQTADLKCKVSRGDHFQLISRIHVFNFSDFVQFHDKQKTDREASASSRAPVSIFPLPVFFAFDDDLSHGISTEFDDVNNCNTEVPLPRLLYVIRTSAYKSANIRVQRPNLVTPVVSTAALKTNWLKRRRRDVDLVSAMSASNGGMVTENLANNLLEAYDLLLSKGQNVVHNYISNVQDLLSGFCSQTADTPQNVKAEGRDYTLIQMQNFMPNSSKFNQTTYSIAGTSGKTLSFGANFVNVYGKCSSDRCSGVCLGTSRTKSSVLKINQYMAAYFAPSSYNAVGMSQLASDLYEIYFMDPNSGRTIDLSENVNFTIRVPMLKYLPSAYYKCLTFVNSAWISDFCSSGSYATSVKSNEFQLECTCQSGGFIAVFSVFAPTPLYYPPHNELNLTVKFSTNNKCSADDANNFFESLVQATGLEKSRFVKPKCLEGGWSSFKLRPAFRENQTSNSYAMQTLKKAMLAPSGFVAYGNNVKVVNVTDVVVKRNLTNDGNARRISLRIDRSFKETVGNDSALLAETWIQRMSNNMRISAFRFKSAHIAIGMMFNFTITLPFSGESSESALTAEEIAIWIQEQTVYKELELLDTQNQQMPIEELQPNEIVQLVVSRPLSPLAAITCGLVSLLCILITFCVGGLVFVKLRTDRLIEKHNQRNADVSHIVPLPVIPYENPLMTTGFNAQEEEHLQMAADTVVFGRRN